MNIKVADSTLDDIELTGADMATIVVALIDYTNKNKSDISKEILKKLGVNL